MVAVSGSGSYLMTASEVTIHTEAAAGVYELHVDLASMGAGDTIVFRVKEPVLSGGTARTVSYLTASGAQAEPSSTGEYSGQTKRLGPVVSDQGVSVTAQQTATGTLRTIPWKLVRIA